MSRGTDTVIIGQGTNGSHSNHSRTTVIQILGGDSFDHSCVDGVDLGVDFGETQASTVNEDLAANVLTGPAATKFTLTRSAPRSRARYRDSDSRAALDTPIQS